VNMRTLCCTFWTDSLRQKMKCKNRELSREITDSIMFYGTINESKRGLAVQGKGVVMGNTL
jgi:hypothetical protein